MLWPTKPHGPRHRIAKCVTYAAARQRNGAEGRSASDRTKALRGLFTDHHAMLRRMIPDQRRSHRPRYRHAGAETEPAIAPCFVWAAHLFHPPGSTLSLRRGPSSAPARTSRRQTGPDPVLALAHRPSAAPVSAVSTTGGANGKRSWPSAIARRPLPDAGKAASATAQLAFRSEPAQRNPASQLRRVLSPAGSSANSKLLDRWLYSGSRNAWDQAHSALVHANASEPCATLLCFCRLLRQVSGGVIAACWPQLTYGWARRG